MTMTSEPDDATMTTTTSPTSPTSPTPPSARRYAREAIALRSWIDWLLLALIVATPLAFYLNAARDLPGATLAARTALAFPDSQYFDAFRAIGNGHLGERAILERRGQGFLSFPIVPFVIPAILMRTIGVTGLYVAVAVMLWMAVVAARVMLRCAGLRSRWATIGAGVMVIVPWAGFATVAGTQVLNVWYPRFGRPIGTLPQTLLALAMLALLARSPAHRARAGVWSALALGVGLTLQGDLHTGIVLGLVAGVAWIACVATIGPGRIAIATLASAAVGAISLAPFAIARLMEHPDGPAHLGRMPLARSWPFVDANAAFVAYVAIAVGVGVGVALLARRAGRRGDASAAEAYRVAWHLPWAIGVAYAALPISIAVLGQGAQLFHFRDTIRVLFSIEAFYGLFLALQSIGHARPRVERWLTAASLAVPTLAIALPATFVDALPTASRDGDARPGWRAAFVEVTNYLASDACAGDRVIGTFDPNVYPVWSGLMGRYAYCSDILTTTLPDAITERRLLELMRLLSMSSADAEAFLASYETLFYRLGQGKYTATRAYALDPIDAYSAADQRTIRAAPLTHAWSMLLSRPERARLMAAYDAIEPGTLSGRLDLIVLRPADRERGMRVPLTFERAFGNDFFEVYRRRAGQPPPSGESSPGLSNQR